MISLMQEDTRKEKERGVENLTIGYFVMKVQCTLYTVIAAINSNATMATVKINMEYSKTKLSFCFARNNSLLSKPFVDLRL